MFVYKSVRSVFYISATRFGGNPIIVLRSVETCWKQSGQVAPLHKFVGANSSAVATQCSVVFFFLALR